MRLADSRQRKGGYFTIMSTDTPAFSLLSEDDLYLFNEGSHLRLYEKLGAHPVCRDGHQI